MEYDENQLWQDYKKNNNLESREKIILHYVPLVRYVAGRFAPGLKGYFEFDDLVSAGIHGLIKAVERFNPDLGFKFETYAISRIKGSIVDWLRSINWVPHSTLKKAQELEDAMLKLEQELGRAPTDQETADYLGLSMDEYQQLLQQTAPITLISLDELQSSAGEDGNSNLPFQELIPDPNAVDPSSSLEYREVKETLAEAIRRLPEREALVITLYYYEGLTLKEIGQVLEVSESRVSQLHTKAVLRLRGKLSRKKKELIV